MTDNRTQEEMLFNNIMLILASTGEYPEQELEERAHKIMDQMQEDNA